MLRQHPERVVCIVGEPASLDDLRERQGRVLERLGYAPDTLPHERD